MTGKIHSIQTMGTLDGPGVRFVLFMQGCHLRCKCCHNPDTWAMEGGEEYTPEELVSKAVRYKEYFADEGGVTVSGGEPLLQSEFVTEFFALCHKKGINTCLDTSGSIINDKIKTLRSETDRVLLDIKYTNNSLYRENVGCDMKTTISFLGLLDEMNIPVTIRQVIIPGINDDDENATKLKEIAGSYSCVDGIELLPFRKICITKYEQMGIDFPFKDIPEPDKKLMDRLKIYVSGVDLSASGMV